MKNVHLTFFLSLRKKKREEVFCLSESHVEILITHTELMVFHN